MFAVLHPIKFLLNHVLNVTRDTRCHCSGSYRANAYRISYFFLDFIWNLQVYISFVWQRTFSPAKITYIAEANNKCMFTLCRKVMLVLRWGGFLASVTDVFFLLINHCSKRLNQALLIYYRCISPLKWNINFQYKQKW